jgi:ATP-binding cassette subfamily B protein
MVDIGTRARERLRERIGYVEQEAPVLAGTIADNLRLGAADATDEQLMRSLGLVGLSGIVARSPLGLEAPVGDDGVLLSGGQRQRPACTRMMLTDPEIILRRAHLQRRFRDRAGAARNLGLVRRRPDCPGLYRELATHQLLA